MLLALAIVAFHGVPAAATQARANLLLITVDTLRADFLGCYGFQGNNTPNLDRLASQGVLFEDTITVIGKTGPAFASLFSSLYPPTHGARRNGVRMREDVPVLAEKLRDAGYTTGAFISNWTLKSHLSGTHRGFDLYDDENFDRERNSFGAVERDAADVTNAAVRWLDSAPADRPIFLWIHYSEPHSPYDLKSAHAPKAEGKGEGDGPRSRRYKYSSEVGYVDHWIGNFLTRAEKRLPAASTLTVFLSDHGESLGEHDYWGHGKNTHWPNLRIPLVVRGPDIPAGRRVSAGASIVDVLPTILDRLKLPVLTGAEGHSLASTWDHQDPDHHLRFAMGERPTALTKKGREHYNHPLVISAQNDAAKAVYDFADGKIIYYDLRADAAEEKPLAGPPVEMRPPLGRQLSDWYKGLAKYEQDKGELSPEDLQQLRSLGYLDG
ncbi:MAG TPA: sulfatase [Thermoanaerobaculia bacterium]|jgi:arylsulfatase A-like enzyme|nr:sulfatase [Thermoanaerobaculia bacterium]